MEELPIGNHVVHLFFKPAKSSVFRGISWKQSIYEGNRATGVGATAMGSNYPQYGGAGGVI